MAPEGWAPYDESGDQGRPLPPEDRLWRHPSELGRRPGVAAGAPRAFAGGPALLAASSTWGPLLAAALAGAALATGVLALTGSLGERVVERSIIERVAVGPLLWSPTGQGVLGVSQVAERVGPSVARVEVQGPAGVVEGTAVALRDDGHLLTSAQLVAGQGAGTISVVVADRRFDAQLVGADRLTDVAVLRVPAGWRAGATMADPLEVATGDAVVVVGAASAGMGRSPEVGTSIVSAMGQRVQRPGKDDLHGLLRVDLPAPPGGPGAALADSRGALIGFIAGVSAVPARYSYAVPIDIARAVAGDLIEYGAARHCWLGIEGLDLAGSAGRAPGAPEGASVRAVIEGSPAAAAGLRSGDVIATLGGQRIGSMSDLVVTLRRHRPGDAVLIGYWREGRHAEVEVVLGERP